MGCFKRSSPPEDMQPPTCSGDLLVNSSSRAGNTMNAYMDSPSTTVAIHRARADRVPPRSQALSSAAEMREATPCTQDVGSGVEVIV